MFLPILQDRLQNVYPATCLMEFPDRSFIWIHVEMKNLINLVINVTNFVIDKLSETITEIM